MIVGLFLKNYKIYNNINFIPVSNGENFCAYIGQNGAGKSSVLEAFDTFFNNRPWNVNKFATSRGGFGYINQPYIVPIFLIEKNDIKIKGTYNELFEKISNYIWNTLPQNTGNQSGLKYFIDFRDELKKLYSPEKYYLLTIGIRKDDENKVYFGPFQHQKDFLQLFSIEKTNAYDSQTENTQKEDEDLFFALKDFPDILNIVKNYYHYIYIPSEINIQEYTKLETADMQKLMHSDIRNEIKNAITPKNLETINNKLQTFIDKISDKLVDYTYEKDSSGKTKITMNDLIDTIIKAYFSIRVLTRSKNPHLSVSTLSSGEKRKALIDVATAFLDAHAAQERKIIFAIDEPELSLHISACFEQFEKLRYISDIGHQILITTHWYGFIPVIGQGIIHDVVKETEDSGAANIEIKSYSLNDIREKITVDGRYRRDQLTSDIYLKSKYDFIQSVIASLRADIGYNYLFVEGSSDALYLKFYLDEIGKNNNLKIIPLGGVGEVISILNFLQLSLSSQKEQISGKVIGLIDTDETVQSIKDFRDSNYIYLRRIRFNHEINDIVLELPTSQAFSPPTTIESVLLPEPFYKALSFFSEVNAYEELSFINGNSFDSSSKCSYNFIDMRGSERHSLNHFFENPGMKSEFAAKYCELANKSIYPTLINELLKIYNFEANSQNDVDANDVDIGKIKLSASGESFKKSLSIIKKKFDYDRFMKTDVTFLFDELKNYFEFEKQISLEHSIEKIRKKIISNDIKW